ncbi:Fe-S protein assembly co-chaperone HscB [Brackiella oedipodis]|uniref:Fe-S protein assembly co-chaperone HscB n=1 Tax=Brackiella oedipodis TaxID=124225 RepID=UPI00048AEB10|nr:Fe-S protein assembly co-chaperone HscB [Brackiella oedipodis]
MKQNYFQLFNLEPRFQIEEAALQQAWREAASKVHPDRFATALAAERRVAIQWSGIINQAYDTLKKPLARAIYLLELAGHDVQAENNTCMDPSFLMTQMQLREQLDEATGDTPKLQAMQAEILQTEHDLANTMQVLLDEQQDYDSATQKAREWMFIDKIHQEINAKLP